MRYLVLLLLAGSLLAGCKKRRSMTDWSSPEYVKISCSCSYGYAVATMKTISRQMYFHDPKDPNFHGRVTCSTCGQVYEIRKVQQTKE